jgi:hypothetical protein
LNTSVLPLKEIAREETVELPADCTDVFTTPEYLKINKEEEWNQNNIFVYGVCDAIENKRTS